MPPLPCRQTVRWPVVVWSVCQLLWLGSVSGWECTPLVLCPALLRDPATHLVGSRAVCSLSDGSRGVLCHSERDSQAVTDRQRGATGHRGYYRYKHVVAA